MRTDKQLLRIFETEPDWIFQLTGMPSPGASTLRSLTIKALERRADGVVVPDATVHPLTVVEFQFQEDPTVYPRIVVEMALLQQSHQMRPVQGLIFFGYNELDPKTEPWTQVVRSYSFPDVLRQFEQSHPGHPLVAAFKPLVVEDDAEVRRDAAAYYRTIRDSDLPIACKQTLQEVFVSWLEQRLTYLGKKEIEMILLGELPELEETQSGKDLIRIGEARGEARGLVKAVLLHLSVRHGEVPDEVERQIRALSAEQAERLLQFVLQCETLAEVTQWLRGV
jgi:predicted transposase YdaD